MSVITQSQGLWKKRKLINIYHEKNNARSLPSSMRDDFDEFAERERESKRQMIDEYLAIGERGEGSSQFIGKENKTKAKGKRKPPQILDENISRLSGTSLARSASHF